ncbi:MAG: sulfite exporter TauE/SafE family protein, partial [bacterium]
VMANATNTVALWPGAVTASTSYIPELKKVRQGLPLRIVIALSGGVIGAFLLLASSNAFFFMLVPWLLAIATLLFAFSKPIVRWFTEFARGHRAQVFMPFVLEFLFAIYGGYFGAGLGVLLMAGLALAGHSDTQIANAQKNLLAAAINGIAAALFVVLGAVRWAAALCVMAGAIAGGYAGARAARAIPDKFLRATVIAAGAAMSVFYFVEVYGR